MKRRFFLKLISLASGLFGVGKAPKVVAKEPGISPFDAYKLGIPEVMNIYKNEEHIWD